MLAIGFSEIFLDHCFLNCSGHEIPPQGNSYQCRYSASVRGLGLRNLFLSASSSDVDGLCDSQ